MRVRAFRMQKTRLQRIVIRYQSTLYSTAGCQLTEKKCTSSWDCFSWWGLFISQRSETTGQLMSSTTPLSSVLSCLGTGFRQSWSSFTSTTIHILPIGTILTAIAYTSSVYFLTTLEAYTPESAICTDDCLILWKGRLVFRQHIPNKRSRFGIKLYALCESTTGYMHRFRVYTGKEDPVTEPNNDLP